MHWPDDAVGNWPENSAPSIVEGLVCRGSFVDYTVRLDDDSRLKVRGGGRLC